jgi:hypothetical protein
MSTFASPSWWTAERTRIAVGAVVVLAVGGVLAFALRATVRPRQEAPPPSATRARRSRTHTHTHTHTRTRTRSRTPPTRAPLSLRFFIPQDHDEAERAGKKPGAAPGGGAGSSASSSSSSSSLSPATVTPSSSASSASPAPRAAAPAPAAAPASMPASGAGAGAAALAPSPGGGGGSGGGGGGGSGGGGFPKAKLKLILKAMISKFESHKTSQQARQEEMERAGVPQEAIMQSLQGELVQRLQVIEGEIQQQFGADQEALMAAQELHKEDAEVAALMREIKLLFFGAEQVAEIEANERRAEGNLPAGMTAEKFLPVFDAHVAHVHAFAVEKMHEVKRDTPGATFEERTQYHSYLLSQNIEAVHSGFLASAGLSPDEFQACLVKFGNGKHLVEKMIASEQRLKEASAKILG